MIQKLAYIGNFAAVADSARSHTALAYPLAAAVAAGLIQVLTWTRSAEAAEAVVNLASTGAGAAVAVRDRIQIFERILAGITLLVLLPLLAAIAAAILVDGGRPVLFRQQRVGKDGTNFFILKFRSMRSSAPGPSITAHGDARVTRVGGLLRRLKLDELPQLWNVLAGEMSFIGPRPEVPEYVRLDSSEWRNVLRVRPGITDLATLLFRDEERELARASDPDVYYRNTVLPEKLRLNLLYLDKRSLRSDLLLILLTVRYSFWPRGFDAGWVRQLFLRNTRA
ncbi:MAG: sugar transferase [Bryobacteraceae bacterium]